MKYFSDITPTPMPAPLPLPARPIAPVTVSNVLTKLTDEQQQVLTELEAGKSVVVDSVCGSGKTRCLQEVCNTFSNKRILYLTYNRLLKLDAQEKIKNHNTTVQNYHGFVYKYLIRRNYKVQPDKQIRTFLEKCSDIPLIYDIICVDEYQDLEEETAELLLHIAKECPNAQWVFVGDMRQKIYDKTKLDVYKGCIDKICPDYSSVSFTNCFRISSEHADHLSQLWDKHIIGCNENCQVTYTDDFNKILQVIDETPNEDVLVLGPRYGLTPEIVNVLERRNPAKYNKNTVWTSIKDRDENNQIQPGSLIVTTYDGCKGLERKVCIVIDWTNQHFRNRVEKPFTDQTIIRNLFCVAASRGKDKIMFYLDKPNHKADHFLCKQDLMSSYTQELPSYSPSAMFDFKHPQDILACMDCLTIIDEPQDDITPLQVCMQDANIDLSPAVGMYQEMAFFKNYNFTSVLDSLDNTPLLQRIKRHLASLSATTVEQQALALAANDTQLFRYCSQANEHFITDDQKKALQSRLLSKLDANNKKIQVGCHIVADFTAIGRIDYVDKKNIPWELKFTSTLSNAHYLQAAMYSLMLGSPFAYLWNVRTNELKKVSVNNKEEFLSKVYDCITMHRKLRRN